MARRAKKKKYTDHDRELIAEAGREVKGKEPRIVGKTRRKYGEARAKAQKTSIVLSKARRAGAHIPMKKRKKKYRRM